MAGIKIEFFFLFSELQLRAGDALQQEIPAQERKTGQSGRSRIRRAKQKKRRNAGVIEERKRDA